jgi:hypothetical protein
VFWVDNTRASYSEGREFKSRPVDRQFWLKMFVVSLSSSRTMPVYNRRFLSNPFQFIIHLSPFHSTLQIWVTGKASLNKLQINNWQWFASFSCATASTFIFDTAIYSTILYCFVGSFCSSGFVLGSSLRSLLSDSKIVLMFNDSQSV